MADETKTATVIPANELPNRATDGGPNPSFEPGKGDFKEPAAQRVAPSINADPDPIPAADRVRAFEDEYLGAGAVRIGGRIERGSGSPFAALDPEKKRQYAALERLGEAEQKLVAAHDALIQAQVDHEASLAAAEPKPDAE